MWRACSWKPACPCLFGVLTTDTIEQAVERAGTKAGNKGWDAALAALEMVNLLRNLPEMTPEHGTPASGAPQDLQGA